MVFDFFYTQYLFSAATILAISTLLHGKDRQSDEDQFEVTVSFLVQLQDNGNYAAAEFHKHIEAITDLMYSTKVRLGSNPQVKMPQRHRILPIIQFWMQQSLSCRLHSQM